MMQTRTPPSSARSSASLSSFSTTCSALALLLEIRARSRRLLVGAVAAARPRRCLEEPWAKAFW